MKKQTLVTIIFSLLIMGASLGQITFQKTLGGAGLDYAKSVKQTIDSGFVIAGYTNSFGAGDFDVYLIKTNNAGTVSWYKTYGGAGDDEGYDVKQTIDGGYIIVGQTNSFGTGDYDIYVIKTSNNGSVQWSKTFGGSDTEYGYSIQQTNDTGYVITGRSESYTVSAGDVYIIKIDSNGSLLWSRVFSCGGSDEGESVKQTIDGGYIIAGFGCNYGIYWGICLIKCNNLGVKVWEKTFSTAQFFCAAYDVLQTNDGSYVITGRYEPAGFISDVFLMKIDSIGNVLWKKTYGGPNDDRGYSLQQTNDNGFIIVGRTNSFGAGNYDTYLVKTDSVGNMSWSETYGTAGYDFGYSVQQTIDKGYILSGSTSITPAGNDHIYFIKTDSIGNSNCNQITPSSLQSVPVTIDTNAVLNSSAGCTVSSPISIVGNSGTTTTFCFSVGINDVTTMLNSANIFPNPVINELNVIVNNKELSEIILYDFASRKILQQQFTNAVSLNTEQLAKGLYLYEVRDKNGLCKKGKVVKD